MSDFVNYNKRSIDLPPGCKDLIDVLRPKMSKAAAIPAPGATMSDDETGTILSISEYIETFLKNPQTLLMIYKPDEKVSFGITRWADDPISACVEFAENPLRDEHVREFFARHGLEAPVRTATPPEFVLQAPGWVTFPIRLFPSDTRRLIEIATAFFCELCDATEETPLHFRYFNLG
jgi:hypothetical protein